MVTLIFFFSIEDYPPISMGKNFLQEYLVFFTSIFFSVLDFKKKIPPSPLNLLRTIEWKIRVGVLKVKVWE